jgi:hypothetical protein
MGKNLKEKFNSYSSLELITIAEPNSDYTHLAKNIAIDIIQLREKNNEIDVIIEAKTYWVSYIESNIKYIILNKRIPKSHFLNDLQMKDLLKNAFTKWKEKQELLGLDMTKYWAVPF